MPLASDKVAEIQRQVWERVQGGTETQRKKEIEGPQALLPWENPRHACRPHEGEQYALLFDRVQLALGRKQRYGTQIGFDDANRAFVLSIEQPDQVDERRKSLDMMPLADYVRIVARFNQAFAPSEPIFSGDCAER